MWVCAEVCNKIINEMRYNSKLDHHSEEYAGVEGLYTGMDKNDYLVEESLKSLDS